MNDLVADHGHQRRYPMMLCCVTTIPALWAMSSAIDNVQTVAPRSRNGRITMNKTMLHIGVGTLLAILASAAARAEPPKLPVPAIDQSAVALRGYFYVGGQYVGEPDKSIMQGQVYVEVLAPKDVRRPYPLVLIHGAGQTATNWMGTPDGRKGWAEYFVEQGYVVYMIDQPMRGRSAWHPGDGATRMFTAANEQF